MLAQCNSVGETERLSVSALPTKPTCRTIRGNEIAMISRADDFIEPGIHLGHQIVEAIRAHETVSRREARSRACRLLSELGIADPWSGCKAIRISFPAVCAREL